MKVRWVFAWLVAYPLAKLVLGLRVYGRRNLVQGGQILATNHQSNLDPVVVGLAASREVHFLAKEELFQGPRAFAWLIRSYNAWPIRRGGADAAAMHNCSRLLLHRQSLVLFPEGTRSRSGEIARFKPGVGMLAVTNGVPVIPTRISGLDTSAIAYRVDRDFARRGLRRPPAGRARVSVHFGKPLYPKDFTPGRRGYVELTKEVEAEVRSLAQ